VTERGILEHTKHYAAGSIVLASPPGQPVDLGAARLPEVEPGQTWSGWSSETPTTRATCVLWDVRSGTWLGSRKEALLLGEKGKNSRLCSLKVYVVWSMARREGEKSWCEAASGVSGPAGAVDDGREPLNFGHMDIRGTPPWSKGFHWISAPN